MELPYNFKNIAGELLILLKTLYVFYITPWKVNVGTYSPDQYLDWAYGLQCFA